MHEHRPVFISVAQYEDELMQGTKSVFDVIEVAAQPRVDGVELRRETWLHMEKELPEARTRIEELGLLVTFATHATLFNADAAGDAQLRRDIDTARALGSPQLRVFQGPMPADDDDAKWAVGRDAVEYAAERGIVIALENYARTPGGTLAEIQHVLDRIQSPALGTNIDIGNYLLHNEDVPNAIRTIGHRAISAHIKDRTADPDEPPTYLGGGVLPLREIIGALEQLPQPLIYCFEFRGGGEAEERIAKSLDTLQALRQ